MSTNDIGGQQMDKGKTTAKVEEGLVGFTDSEVRPRNKRRRHTSQYKLQVVEEADRCSNPGEVGALLRREGIYSSSLSQWRRQRDAGALSGLGRTRGRKPKSALEVEIAKLKKQNEKQKKQLDQAQFIIEVQKKLVRAFGSELQQAEKEDQS